MNSLETLEEFNKLGLSEPLRGDLLRLELEDAVAVLVEAKIKCHDDDSKHLPLPEVIKAVLENQQNETEAALYRVRLHLDMFDYDDVVTAQHSEKPCEGALLLMAKHTIDELSVSPKLSHAGADIIPLVPGRKL